MKENLLHFLWKMKMFQKAHLLGTRGEQIVVLNPGQHNSNQGPDFQYSKIRIDNKLWVGHVEIHANSSDWYAHGHERDRNYDSVILHVVWNHDADVFQQSNSKLVTLELSSYVSDEHIQRCRKLFRKGVKWINCEEQIKAADHLTMLNWKERLFFERMEERSQTIRKILIKTKNDWEATLFILLAGNFGLSNNKEVFTAMAKSIDITLIKKISHDPVLVESLFFGQIGLLNNAKGPYARVLKERYTYFAKKFNLIMISGQVQFFRLRPRNFPTIRLSQLANLYSQTSGLFQIVIQCSELPVIYDLFAIPTSSYWETHYTFKT
jgi:hypothetical protein